MSSRIRQDSITPALKSLSKELNDKKNALLVGNQAKAVIINRTLQGESLGGGAFSSYSKKPYYASAQNRKPGVPAPRGGRKTAKGRVYEGGYGEYKAAIGRGGKPQLSLTGNMLQSIQVHVSSAKRVILFFGDAFANNKASGLHGGKFPFFGIKDSEGRDLLGTLKRQLKKIKGVK